MTNKEWKDLLSSEFHVSRSYASHMLHMLMDMKRRHTLLEKYIEEEINNEFKEHTELENRESDRSNNKADL